MKNLVKFLTLLTAFLVVATLAACDIASQALNSLSTTQSDSTTLADETTTKADESTTKDEGSTTKDDTTTEHVHVFDQEQAVKAYQVSAATCTRPAVYYYTC